MSGVTAGREVVTALAALEAERRGDAFLSCCGSDAWVSAMTSGWPFETDALLEKAADDAWWALPEGDWLEAFEAHPRIGERDDADQWAGAEQASVDEADPETLAALAEESRAYEERFGHAFLICATDLGADQVLGALRRRIRNDPGVELQVAATEQARITRLRLGELPRQAPPVVEPPGKSNTLSTHVLDTTTGRPAAGIAVDLSRAATGDWRAIGSGTTGADGRVDLVDGAEGGLAEGEYRVRFATGAYFRAGSVAAFHSFVDVVFRVVPEGGHYHVPLLLGPFGYTTYRGS